MLVAVVVPAGVVTDMFTAVGMASGPGVNGGVVMLILVPSGGPDNTANGAGLPPMVTAVAPPKSDPLMMIDWPPPSGPVAGLTVLIVGGSVDPKTNADVF